MKKSSIIITVILVLILGLTLFASCKGKEKEEEKSALEKRLSTYQDAVYVGSNEDFQADFITGEKEKLIVIDGEVGEMIPFATLTVTPRSSALFNNTYSYVLTGEAGEKRGELVKDVVGAAFSAEVTGSEEIGKILSLKIVSEGIMESEITFVNKVDGTISRKQVLEIAEREFRDAINAESDTGNLEREIYVKLVNALSDEEAPYYYYVSFIKSPSDYWALLLDPMTGEVISKKI